MVYDDGGSLIHTFGPTEYTQESEEEQTLIVNEIKTGLTLGGQYEVEVTVTSMGISHSKRETFGKLCMDVCVCDY